MVKGRKGETVVDADEQPLKARTDKIPTLKPAFRPDGTVTAANSSSISDGGAALVLMRRSEADRPGFALLAATKGHATPPPEPSGVPPAPSGPTKPPLTPT